LALQDRFQFQWWALSLVGASPVGDERKKGADRGIDGLIGFVEAGGKAKHIIVSVKSGGTQVRDIRDLKGTMEREKADMALFITLEPPTVPMREEALSAGFYTSELWQARYPRIQICTIENLLGKDRPGLPRATMSGFSQAPRAGVEPAVQPTFSL
jgi:site-specific DNA-methyltransferase (adenine-specific)